MNLGSAVSMDGMNVLVVGGGGAGIGSTCARTIGATGAKVGVVDITMKRAEESAAQVRDEGGQSVAFAADVMSLDDLQRLISDADKELDGIDGVVTIVGGINAINVPNTKVADEDDDDWQKMIDFNLKYVFRTARLVIKSMLARGRGGSLVAIGSFAGGWHGAPMMGTYGAAKIAVASLAMTVASEYGPDGIRMNVVCPGWTETPVGGYRSDDQTNKLLSAIPLRRRGKPQDIANAVTFLLSPAAGYISGQVLSVDGGAAADSYFLNAGWS
jgi:3-oxoacyl-[acyl-carrier protein] reductase